MNFFHVWQVGRVILNAPLQGAFGRRIKDNPPYLENLNSNHRWYAFIDGVAKETTNLLKARPND
jgi:hypothetical protein